MLIITEGVEGYYVYHFSKPESFTRSLCGKPTMKTSLSMSQWGQVGHLKERYCKECENIKNNPTPTGEGE